MLQAIKSSVILILPAKKGLFYQYLFCNSPMHKLLNRHLRSLSKYHIMSGLVVYLWVFLNLFGMNLASAISSGHLLPLSALPWSLLWSQLSSLAPSWVLLLPSCFPSSRSKSTKRLNKTHKQFAPGTAKHHASPVIYSRASFTNLCSDMSQKLYSIGQYLCLI